MKIDLISASGAKINRDLHGKIVVVIDVLRASSTIITALANGCTDLLPVVEPGEAAFISKQLGAGCLTGGERNGLKIPGFDLGNSPLEYSAEVVTDKRIILCTSNGSKALKEAQNAKEILIGAFLNASKTSAYLKDKQEVIFFCAGSNGELGLEDILCAGLLLENILVQGVEVELTDIAQLSLIAYRYLVGEKTSVLADVLYQAKHARYLSSLGFAEDITYCAQLDLLPFLVRCQSGRVTMDQSKNH